MLSFGLLRPRNRWILALGGYLLVPVLLLGALLGCSDNTASVDTCVDEAPPEMAAIPDEVLLRGSALVEMRSVYDIAGAKTDSALINFSLVDLTTWQVDSRFPAACCGSMACFNLTGSPNEGCRGTAGGPCGRSTCGADEVCVEGQCKTCARESLTADKVVIAGTAAGDLELTANSTNDTFIYPTAPTELFASGPLTLQVTGRSEPGFVQDYEQQLEVPSPLKLLAPTLPASAGNVDLDLKWEKGNGDWIEVVLRSSNPKITDKVVCIAKDDGCASIPAGAFDLAKQNMTSNETFSVTMARIKQALKTVSSGKVVSSLKLSRRIDLSLSQ